MKRRSVLALLVGATGAGRGAGASIRQFDLFGGTAQPRAGGGADLGEQGFAASNTADPPSTVERDANAP